MSWSMFSRFGAGSDPDIVNFGDLEEAVGANAWTVVDVREPYEFAAGHIPNALNIPMSSFDPKELPQGKPVVLNLSVRRTVAQCAEQGAGDRPRGR
jgi:rhodanese-related sulfurtransferase